MMKRTLLFLLLTFVPLFALEAKDYEVRGPVLILHGTGDKIVPESRSVGVLEYH